MAQHNEHNEHTEHPAGTVELMHVRESGVVVVVVVVVCGWGGGAHPINEGFDGGGHEDAEKRLQDGERGHAGDGAGDLVQVAHEVVAQVQRDAQRLGSGQKARPGGIRGAGA